MVKLTILTLAAITMVGCSSTSSLTSEQKAQLMVQHQQQKTFEIECEYGCKVSYKDPRDKLVIPKETNGYDVANTVVNGVVGVVTSVAPWAAVGVIATQGIKNSGDRYDNSYNTTDANNVDNTATPTVVEQMDPTIVDRETVQIVNPEVVQVPTTIVEPTVVEPVVVTP